MHPKHLFGVNKTGVIVLYLIVKWPYIPIFWALTLAWSLVLWSESMVDNYQHIVIY